MAVQGEGLTRIEGFGQESEGKMTIGTVLSIGFTYEELCESLAQVMNERDELLEKVYELELKIAIMESKK